MSAVKRALREGGYTKVKVGHGGTLDPLASGVLPIALGEATKLAGRMLDSDKVYDFTIEFGSETSQWWNSLAVAVIFGLAFATILTLVVVPTFYRAFYGRAEARRVAALAGGTANEA